MAIRKDLLNKKIGNYIKGVRKAKGYTQEGISRALGKSRPTIVNIEAGRQSPSMEILIELSNILSIDIFTFISNNWVESSKTNIKNKIKYDTKSLGIKINRSDLEALSKKLNSVTNVNP